MFGKVNLGLTTDMRASQLLREIERQPAKDTAEAVGKLLEVLKAMNDASQAESKKRDRAERINRRLTIAGIVLMGLTLVASIGGILATLGLLR